MAWFEWATGGSKNNSSATSKKKVILPKNLTGKAKVKTPSTASDTGQEVPNPYTSIIQETVQTQRDRGQIAAALRQLADIDALTSNAVNSYISLAMSGGFKVKASITGTHQFSAEGTVLAQNVLASFNTIYDYTKKYQDKPAMSAIIETFLKDILMTGGIGAELILDEARLPHRIQTIDYSDIAWKSNGKGGKFPTQKGDGEAVDLNFATVWVEEFQRDSSQAYVAPMLYSSINSSFFLQEYVEDMRRVLKKSGHSRLVATLIADKIAASAPESIKDDEVKLAAYMTDQVTNVTETLRGLEPEEAVIAFDSVEFDNHENRSTKTEYTPLLKVLGNFAATGLKTPASILGLRIDGSQSLSNAETATFTRQISSLQSPINRILSRAITLAVRLYGVDVYCEFKMGEPDMRTENESAAFHTMKQTMVLQQLSLGLISDEEAAWELGRTLPQGYAPLAGTQFMSGSGNAESSVEAPNQNAGAQNEQLAKKSSPTSAGGGSK